MPAALLGTLLLGLTCLGGCGQESRPEVVDVPVPAPHTAGPQPGPDRLEEASRLARVVGDPRARLVEARVERRRGSLVVAAWWRCAEPGCPRPRDVLAVSADGFASVWYRRNPARTLDRVVAPLPHRPRVEDARVRDLLQHPVPSLVPGTRVVLAGGDGATLLPFEKVATSTDDGRTWQVDDVHHPGGEMPYVSGAVLLDGGRLLSLVNTWSGDRRRRLSSRPRGLLLGTRLEPAPVRFRPALPPDPEGRSGIATLGARPGARPLVWVTTSDERLHVSTDGARTFTEVPAR